MPVFKTSDQIYEVLKTLFQRIGEDHPSAADAIMASKMIMRIRLTEPAAEITVSGRTNPVRVFYGSSTLRPDFDVQMQTDTFHQILLGDLPLGKALGNGKLKVKGPIYKSSALADIFHRGQAVYPAILDEYGVMR